MPIVSSGVTIPFDGESQKLIAESNKVIAELARVKEATKATNASMAQAAKQAESAAKKSTMGWTEFRSMYSTVLDVVRVGQAVWDETGQKFLDYTDKVRDTSRTLGVSAEEAARLIQVGDDVFISYDKMTAAMKMAQKDGFEPNIEGLAKMADEYTALAPGVERTQYLLDRFGKSGAEMGKLLEQGGAGVREMSAAIDESLVPTQAALDQAQEYKIAQDELNEVWEQFTYKVGPKIIGVTTDIINSQRDGIRATEILKEQGYNGLIPMYTDAAKAAMAQATAEREQADAARLAAEASQEASGSFEDQAEMAKQLAEEAQAAEQAIKDITKANQEYLDTLGSVSDRHAKHQDAIDKVNQEYADGNITIDERNQKLQELADEQEEASHRMILSMLEQELALDGLSAKETDYLIQKGVEWGIYSDTAIQEIREARAEVARLTSELNGIPTSINVAINVSGGLNQVGGSGGVNQQLNYASGGSFIIPEQYGYEGFNLGGMATASGGEQVTITPKGQTGGYAEFDYKKMGKEVARAFMAMGG